MYFVLKPRNMIILKNAVCQKVLIMFLGFILFNAFPAFAQKYGCTDSAANNYDPAATINNGSCTYNETDYSPVEKVNPLSDTIKESSGLVWAGNFLWSFNDSGNPPELYRIDSASGIILQTVRLEGATNVDWEEAAFDGTYFYVGDFGNNSYGNRTDLKIYKFPFSAISDYTTNPADTIPVGQIKVIEFRYRDQPSRPDSIATNTTKFDCEAMLVDSGKIHLFTKNWIDYTTTHYVINGDTAGTYVAIPVDTLETGYLVTGAAMTPNKKAVVLLGYENPYQSPLQARVHMHILSDYSNGKYFNGNKRMITLPLFLQMGQAEGIAFRNDNYGYISNERVEQIITINQKLYSFDISSFAPSVILAQELANFSVSKINDVNKISWKFSAIVHNLQIQQSSDGLHFTVVKTYNTSNEDFFNNKSLFSENYYRLAWKQDNEGDQYSKIIHIKNEETRLLNHILLKANGELSFILNGNQSQNFAFKLLTTDGKLVARLNSRNYVAGSNKVNFPVASILNGVVILTIYNNNQKTSNLLHINK